MIYTNDQANTMREQGRIHAALILVRARRRPLIARPPRQKWKRSLVFNHGDNVQRANCRCQPPKRITHNNAVAKRRERTKMAQPSRCPLLHITIKGATLWRRCRLMLAWFRRWSGHSSSPSCWSKYRQQLEYRLVE